MSLRTKSIDVLELIAAGRTYEQILTAHPELSYLDIFRAAEEAVGLLRGQARLPKQSLTLPETRRRYPRAYQKWTEAEDVDLARLVRSGATVAQIAGRLQRNRGAIRSRIIRLNLVEALTPREQDRLRRIVERRGQTHLPVR